VQLAEGLIIVVLGKVIELYILLNHIFSLINSLFTITMIDMDSVKENKCKSKQIFTAGKIYIFDIRTVHLAQFIFQTIQSIIYIYVYICIYINISIYVNNDVTPYAQLHVSMHPLNLQAVLFFKFVKFKKIIIFNFINLTT